MTGAIFSSPASGPGGPLDQLEQPAADDRAVPPDRRDLVQVERELVGRLHQLEPLGIGLHQAVLDAVVDHLDEVAGADRPDVGVAPLRRQRLEGRLDDRHRFVGPPDHQAVPLRQPPDAAGRPGVDEADALLGQLRRRRRGLLVVRVAAVDDDVARLEVVGQLGDRRVGRRPRRDHHPRPPAAPTASPPAPRATSPAPPLWPPPRPGPPRTGRTPPPRARPRSSRSVMLAPILPRPTIPIFIAVLLARWYRWLVEILPRHFGPGCVARLAPAELDQADPAIGPVVGPVVGRSSARYGKVNQDSELALSVRIWRRSSKDLANEWTPFVLERRRDVGEVDAGVGQPSPAATPHRPDRRRSSGRSSRGREPRRSSGPASC